MEKAFEIASRSKLRYLTTKGSIATEDLWDLPLESLSSPSLDAVAITISDAIAASGKKSFVKTNRRDDILELKFDIVKYVIAVKIKEAKEAETAKENKDRKELLLDVLAEKEIDELKGKSAKELKKEIKGLQ